jgi:amino acid transporter
VWIATGKPQQIVFHWKNLLPDWHHSNPGFYATMILGFGGLQIIGFHTSNAINPRRDYPRAILLATVIVFSICLFTTLAIATVIPHNDLNLISGFIDSFSYFFTAFGMQWATPVIIFLVVFGTLSTFNAWYLGPARGMAVAAHNGFIPKIFSRLNKHDVPENILLLQGLLCTFFSLIFLYMPDISSSFWILLNLSSQTALLVYIFIFLSALKLRYRNAGKVTSGYRIPGGKLGIWLASGTGVVACSVALVLSVIPPTIVKTGSLWSYESILFLSNLVFFGIPVLILILENKFSNRRKK